MNAVSHQSVFAQLTIASLRIFQSGQTDGWHYSMCTHQNNKNHQIPNKIYPVSSLIVGLPA